MATRSQALPRFLTSSWQRKDDPTKDAATRDRDYRGTGHMGQWHETSGQQDLSPSR